MAGYGRGELSAAGASWDIYRIDEIEGAARLPYSMKVLLENLMRNVDGVNVTTDHIRTLIECACNERSAEEIPFTPARVLLTDFTGVPCIVDFAVMREAIAELGGDPAAVNPLTRADLIIDHSVITDRSGSADAIECNLEREYERNTERYRFLRWGQGSLENVRILPPGTGICHQLNIELLAPGITISSAGVVFPDSIVGADSHTTMINGLSVLGWGVGGIEAEAAMLGQPISMLVPRVVGVRLTGALPDGVTATDLALSITRTLRLHGVVGKFVEFYGPGVTALRVEDRATVSNMCPEYGSTCAIFPVDDKTLDYLRLTGRDERAAELLGAYAKAQGMWHDENWDADYSEHVEIDLADIVPAISGPRRPQDWISLESAKAQFESDVVAYRKTDETRTAVMADGAQVPVRNGSVVIAALTSCTNTSNPSVMLAAGLLARNAAARGLHTKQWVRTILAPGSRVAHGYFEASGLLEPLQELGFYTVGYGCLSCIGNSGQLDDGIREHAEELAYTAVLSGNRNFEGRISPDVKMNYLASPPLVVAYAIAGVMDFDFATEPLGYDADGAPVMLADVWPSSAEIKEAVERYVTPELFRDAYADPYSGDARWQGIDAPQGWKYAWEAESTYIRRPGYFDGMSAEVPPARSIEGARVLARLGDSVTTDHISPAGSIKDDSPAGRYLQEHGVSPRDFNTYGSRRGNHEVMMRGTFANIRLRNQLVPGVEGGMTLHPVTGEVVSIFDAAMAHAQAGTPLIVIAGRDYGCGSSRDWAAKGPMLLGVRAVVAESYERIHRSNLVGMGILPLQFAEGETAESLGLDGTESYTIRGLEGIESTTAPPRVTVEATDSTGEVKRFDVGLRLDTPAEVEYYRNGGILQFMLRRLLAQ
ncbi:MAG: aconitate hydratase AcnA [Actinobacteria bacterium HGW-Actinobacteria-10]|nr:MAG: aconitate hydratase AcnA [Actinobacteria bacterium HGW-Actinobacteria-10]